MLIDRKMNKRKKKYKVCFGKSREHEEKHYADRNFGRLECTNTGASGFTRHQLRNAK
jgi:hypothetical protein